PRGLLVPKRGSQTSSLPDPRRPRPAPSLPRAGAGPNSAAGPDAAAEFPLPDGAAPEATARRQAIVKTAAQVFARRGYRATTMRAIAEACGILPGSLYHHFRGKEDIILEVMAGTTADFVTVLEAIAARPGGSAADKVRDALQARLDLYREQGQALTAVLQTDTDTIRLPVFQSMRELGKRIDAAWDAIIRDGQQRGEFSATLDVRATSYAIIGMLNWAHRWFDPTGRLSAADLTGQWTRLILHGVLAGQTEEGAA
ncbi:MAG TPA: TetR/AcrR family transcriptional regulator, partial [Deinococcales bacterium]|nr:TetR/AcrR family transcriptional regulator [Deinococcales bacterium]